MGPNQHWKQKTEPNSRSLFLQGFPCPFDSYSRRNHGIVKLANINNSLKSIQRGKEYRRTGPGCRERNLHTNPISKELESHSQSRRELNSASSLNIRHSAPRALQIWTQTGCCPSLGTERGTTQQRFVGDLGPIEL